MSRSGADVVAPSSLTETTVLPTVIGSGVGLGSTQALTHLSAVIEEFQQISNRNNGTPFSLAHFIAACRELEMQQRPGLDILKGWAGDDIIGSGLATQTGVARSLFCSISSPATLASHILQTLGDVGLTSQRVRDVISHSTDKSDLSSILQSSRLGQLEGGDDVHLAKNNFFISCQQLSVTIGRSLEKLQEDVAPEAGMEARFHKTLVDISAQTALVPSVSTLGALSSIFGLLGQLLGREPSASSQDISEFDEKEALIVKALSECSKSITDTEHPQQSLDKINNLIEALSHFNELSEHASARRALGLKSSFSLSFLASSQILCLLKIVSYSLLTVIHTQQALSDKEAKLSDRSKASLTDASSLRKEGAEPEPEKNTHCLNVSELIEGFSLVNQALVKATQEKIKDHEAKPALPAEGGGDQVERKERHVGQESIALMAVSDQTVIGGSGLFSITQTNIIALLPSLITGLIGLLSRELALGTQFSKITLVQSSQDSEGELKDKDKKDLDRKASVLRTRRVAQSDSEITGQQLDLLLCHLCNCAEAMEQVEKWGGSSPFLLESSFASLSGGLSAILSSVIGMTLAFKFMSQHPETVRPKEDAPKEGDLAPVEVKDNKDGLSAEQIKKGNLSLSGIVTRSGLAPKEEKMSAPSLFGSVVDSLAHGKDISDPLSCAGIPEHKALNTTARAIVAFLLAPTRSTAINTSAFLTSSLGVMACLGVESVFSIEALFLSLSNTIAAITDQLYQPQTISGGPEKVKFGEDSHTNPFFLCNLLRTLAAKTGQDSGPVSSATVTAVEGSAAAFESTFSRSFLVLICQRKLLTEAIDEMLEEKDLSDRTLEAAKDKIFSHLAGIIKGKLDDLDRHDELLRLNESMASELQSLSQGVILGLLTTHSSVILPFITAIQALKAGSENAKKHKDKHLSGSSLSDFASQFSNTIRGFTIESAQQLNAQAKETKFEGGTLVLSHDSTKISSLQLLFYSNTITLSLVELVEIAFSRSLALIDSQIISEMAKDSKESVKVESSQNSEALSLELKQESHSGESRSVCDVPTVSRLFLTRCGEFLKQSAGQLAKEVSELAKENLLKEGAEEIHSLEVSLLRSVSIGLNYASSLISRLLETTGGVSILPLLLRDKTDLIRQSVQKSDDSLVFGESKVSRESTREEDNINYSSVSTAIITDAIGSFISNLVKTVLKASLIGSDFALATIKVLEILLLHENPSEALVLESQASLQPHAGSSVSASTQLAERFLTSLSLIPLVGIGGGTGFSIDDPCLESSALPSLEWLQGLVDSGIDRAQYLYDPEEKQGSEVSDSKTITLKSYFSAVLECVFGVEKPFIEVCIDRFDKGGFNLSRYHSQYEKISAKAPVSDKRTGLLEGEKKGDSGIKEDFDPSKSLKGIDHINALIQEFILKVCDAYDPESKESKLLNNLITCLADRKPTAAVKKVHEYAINVIANKLYYRYHTAKQTFWGDPRAVDFNKEIFSAQYNFKKLKDPGLSSGAPKSEMEMTPLSKLFEEQRDSRQARAERQRKRQEAREAKEKERQTLAPSGAAGEKRNSEVGSEGEGRRAYSPGSSS